MPSTCCSGGRARRGIVRPGAAEAYVEGVFDLDPALAEDERVPAGAEELVLARRVWPDGRTRAYVCGRAATQADLQELGGRLLAFYGQHEHRRLMLSVEQLELLDAYGGSTHASVRRRLAEAHERVRALGGAVADLTELAGSRDRELDLLRFELDEIEAADPQRAGGRRARRRARPAAPPGGPDRGRCVRRRGARRGERGRGRGDRRARDRGSRRPRSSTPGCASSPTA